AVARASSSRRSPRVQATKELTWLGKLERAKGFEPSTPTLARLCSTPELHPLTCRSGSFPPADGGLISLPPRRRQGGERLGGNNRRRNASPDAFARWKGRESSRASQPNRPDGHAREPGHSHHYRRTCSGLHRRGSPGAARLHPRSPHQEPVSQGQEGR